MYLCSCLVWDPAAGIHNGKKSGDHCTAPESTRRFDNGYVHISMRAHTTYIVCMAQASTPPFPPTPPRHGHGSVCRLHVGGSKYRI